MLCFCTLGVVLCYCYGPSSYFGSLWCISAVKIEVKPETSARCCTRARMCVYLSVSRHVGGPGHHVNESRWVLNEFPFNRNGKPIKHNLKQVSQRSRAIEWKRPSEKERENGDKISKALIWLLSFVIGFSRANTLCALRSWHLISLGFMAVGANLVWFWVAIAAEDPNDQMEAWWSAQRLSHRPNAKKLRANIFVTWSIRGQLYGLQQPNC